MPLTLYWRGAAASIGADDYAVGGTTVENYHGATYDATAARVGSLGGNHDSAVTDLQTRFSNSNDVIFTPQQGCMAAWVRFIEYGAALYSQHYSSWPDNLTIAMSAFGRAQMFFKSGADGQSVIQSDESLLSTNEWYFFIARWNSGAPYRRLEVYNTALSQLAYLESSDSWTLPSELGGRVMVGMTDGTARSHIDNVFCSTSWDEPILQNALIDAYSQYSTGAPWAGALGALGTQRRRSVSIG